MKTKMLKIRLKEKKYYGNICLTVSTQLNGYDLIEYCLNYFQNPTDNIEQNNDCNMFFNNDISVWGFELKDFHNNNLNLIVTPNELLKKIQMLEINE